MHMGPEQERRVSMNRKCKKIGIYIEFRNSEIMNLRMHFLANRQQKVSDLIELLNRMERIHVYLEGESLIIE